MKTFEVYVNNGYRFEYFGEIEAASIHNARKEFQRQNAGTHIALRPFKVSIKASVK